MGWIILFVALLLLAVMLFIYFATPKDVLVDYPTEKAVNVESDYTQEVKAYAEYKRRFPYSKVTPEMFKAMRNVYK